MEEKMRLSELLEHYDYYVNEVDEFDEPMTFDEWRAEFEESLTLITIKNQPKI